MNLRTQTVDQPAGLRRVVSAYRRGGLSYVVYKILKRTLQDRPWLARHVLYRNPRWYWEQRGGVDYYLEQEAQSERTVRSEFIAEQVARFAPDSLLEIGCGYGKQLERLRHCVTGMVVGGDWSSSQLRLASRLLSGDSRVRLARLDGTRLPFGDKSFDVVFTSAVILHNPPHAAEAILREICRVGRRLAIHNEDTNVSFSRFGFDTASAYRKLGCRVLECRTIPGADQSSISQFCVIDLRRDR